MPITVERFELVELILGTVVILVSLTGLVISIIALTRPQTVHIQDDDLRRLEQALGTQPR